MKQSTKRLQAIRDTGGLTAGTTAFIPSKYKRKLLEDYINPTKQEASRPSFEEFYDSLDE